MKSINTLKYIESFLKIRNKAGKIVPLKLNEPQMKLYNVIKEQKKIGKPVRIIILKARQMGFSTLTEGIFTKDTTTKFNRRTGIITHQAQATNNLFSMSKLMYDNLPLELKPAIKRSNAKELVFDNDEGTGLKSSIKCMTAGTDGVGRSDTFDNVHLSELAFWPGNVKETLNGLFQAVPNLPDTMIIVESTANGYETFKEMWDKAVAGENDFIPLFVAWFELKEYQMPYSGFELTDEEKELKELYNLSNNQLEWRRWCIRNNCQGDVEQFKQEYPSNPQEAFISTGKCIFDKEKIIDRIQRLEKPLKRGFFKYNRIGNKISDIAWIESKSGAIDIFIDVKKGHPYVLGGDTAGEGSDYFTGHVIDNSNMKQVARLRQQFDEDEYAIQMYCLGMYYNEALIGLEINYSTYPTKKLQEFGYPNIYLREVEDEIAEKIKDKYGFRTDKITRPIIIAELVEIFRDYIDCINDKDTLEEALVFIKNKDGRPEAQEGYHDDLIMGLAITYYIRTQQRYNVIAVQEEVEVKLPFELQDDYDEEEEW